MGLGSASNKKDAETNAAKDFCGFLIGAGIIPPDSFPDDLFVSVTMMVTVRYSKVYQDAMLNHFVI